MKSKFVQISKDIINIRANTKPTKAEDEDRAIHGFIENRTVFSDTSSGEQFQNRHWPQIQNYLSESYVSHHHCDVSIMVSDGSVLVNRLMILLLFPEILHVCDNDLESVIVPSYTLDQVREFIESLLNSDVKDVKDSDHNNNNSVDDINQDSQIEVDTTKYESEPVVEDVEEANNNNSDNPYDDVEVKEENEEPETLSYFIIFPGGTLGISSMLLKSKFK